MDRLGRIESFARLGFLARGLVYVLMGYLALATSQSKSPENVMAAIGDVPAGGLLLVLVGIGLALYGIFRLYGAIINIDGHDEDVIGWAKRLGHAASGLGHLILAYIATNAGIGSSSPASEGEGGTTGEAASFLLTLPAGEIILALIGLGFIAAAFDQASKAWTGKFMKDLDPDAPDSVETVGKLGHAARTVVFAIIGWNITSSALAGHADEVGGIGLALEKLQQNQTVFSIVAVGLLLFGLFSIVTAWYRRIRNDDVIARFKGDTHG